MSHLNLILAFGDRRIGLLRLSQIADDLPSSVCEEAQRIMLLLL
jgi:hypothetical protein